MVSKRLLQLFACCLILCSPVFCGKLDDVDHIFNRLHTVLQEFFLREEINNSIFSTLDLIVELSDTFYSDDSVHPSCSYSRLAIGLSTLRNKNPEDAYIFYLFLSMATLTYLVRYGSAAFVKYSLILCFLIRYLEGFCKVIFALCIALAQIIIYPIRRLDCRLENIPSIFLSNMFQSISTAFILRTISLVSDAMLKRYWLIGEAPELLAQQSPTPVLSNTTVAASAMCSYLTDALMAAGPFSLVSHFYRSMASNAKPHVDMVQALTACNCSISRNNTQPTMLRPEGTSHKRASSSSIKIGCGCATWILAIIGAFGLLI